MKVYKATNGTFQCQECKEQLNAKSDEVVVTHSWNYEIVLCEKDARKLQAELNQFFSNKGD